MIIKILLIVGLFAVGTYAFRSRATAANLAIRRLVGGLVLALGALSVLSPILVTKVANLVGVQRGTDLMLYVFVVVSLFVWVGLYRRVQDLESRFAKLARRVAITEDAEQRPVSDRSE